MQIFGPHLISGNTSEYAMICVWKLLGAMHKFMRLVGSGKQTQISLIRKFVIGVEFLVKI